ncbi:Linear gramicidin synthase subunit D [Baekduia alba]|uniref:SDR family oxidoreductase n=1 Tax=Baekduia alba TaxID=2997333 RepID=UPI0023402DB7|nr:SDR family oxidoreductase [Baekduia alba]WCB93617.1 Linear gramicidin synthase subunit D [Baekduia alba]
MPRTYLLTGFPGFLAGRLVPRLLADDDEARIVALVEPRMVARARELAPDGVDVQPGDITDPTLGLDASTYDRLAGEVVRVFHLAAVYDLAVGAELAERVNVAGTQHVVDFCRRATQLERHHYISTAYVAGQRSGLVMEDDLAQGQAFKNFYESTKFAAEVIVRAAMDDVPTTIYRPAIVVGDSQTGETQKFDGPYYLLRSMNSPFGALLQIGRGDAAFNVVPVDFVVDAISAGARDPEAVGHTLHLVDPDPVSSAELTRLLAVAYKGSEPKIPLSPGMVDRSLRLRPVRKLFGGTPRQSIIYLNHPVSFDTTQAGEVLGRNGLRCPRFPEYVDNMVAFFKAHEHDDAYRPAHEK